jgi:hypothetical protein
MYDVSSHFIHSNNRKGVRVKDLFVALVVVAQISFCVHYAYRTRHKKNDPTLVMWILFLLGITLSLVTYALDKKYDFASGILNLVDFISVLVILIAVAAWGKRTVHLTPFDWFFLACVAAIAVYAVASGDLWRSNRFCQFIIAIGYIPTIVKMWCLDQNTESFTSWFLALAASAFAILPAMVNGNDLAVWYAVRSLTSVVVILLVMLYYEAKPFVCELLDQVVGRMLNG